MLLPGVINFAGAIKALAGVIKAVAGVIKVATKIYLTLL